MAMQMQAVLASPAGTLANGSRTIAVAFPLGGVPRSAGQARFCVKSMAKDGSDQGLVKKISLLPKKDGADDQGKAKISSASPKSDLAPSQKQGVTSFTDLFAFSGPGPERINGRLAMIGFVTALGVELAKGIDLFDQIEEGGYIWFMVALFLLYSASLVPLLRGKNPDENTDGLMNSKAEIWNGRLAMLGLIALAATEYFKGGALV